MSKSIYIYERIKTPKIETVRLWDSDDVRHMCIKHQYYTAGDNEDYCSMLRYVDEHEPTTESLYAVAVDIFEHSDVDDDPASITSIMYDIEREAVRVFYEIKEG